MSLRDVILLLAGALISLVVVVGNNYFFVEKMMPPQQKFAVIDAPRLFEEKQKEMARLLVAPASSQAQRDEVFERTKNFAEDFDKLMIGLWKECDCIVLSSRSVISSPPQFAMPDLTDQIREKLKNR